jgi:hypothetical protein
MLIELEAAIRLERAICWSQLRRPWASPPSKRRGNLDCSTATSCVFHAVTHRTNCGACSSLSRLSLRYDPALRGYGLAGPPALESGYGDRSLFIDISAFSSER